MGVDPKLAGRLLIVGASARAAAYSARRAGFEPLACDLFADADLRRLCRTFRVRGYPAGLVAAARRHAAAPWLYTGGLENYSEIVEAIGRDRPLLGNSAKVLRAARDPYRFAAALQQTGLRVPRCAPIAAAVGAAIGNQDWLLKRRSSSGGAGVRRWAGSLPPREAASECFLQQHVAGRACAAVYVAARGKAVLLGVTEQLIGAAWCGGRGFQYCGSLGPLRLSAGTTAIFRRIGNCLASELDLVGLFGVDAIVNRSGVWPVEINPRYTASIEVLERALGIASIAWHVDACVNGGLPKRFPPHPRARTWCGKAIVFADRALEIDDRLDQASQPAQAAKDRGAGEGERGPAIADIPTPGSRIGAHRPILTVLAADKTRAGVLRRLQADARHWRAKLGAG